MLKQIAAVACVTAFASGAAADVVEFTLTGSWVAGDFNVATGTDVDPSDPTSDGKVFGVAPSAGSLSVTLTVDTSDVIYVPTTDATSPVHDMYGYNTVSLTDVVLFGDAVFDSIVTGLEGPGPTTAALWTDADLSLGVPTLASFRVFGTHAGGSTADLFFGTRSASNTDGDDMQINPNFLLHEYYGGETIRSGGATYEVTPAVPLPASALLMIGGLGAFGAVRRRAAKTA